MSTSNHVPSQDLQVQHQVSVLRQAAPATKKVDIISAFGKMKVSEEPVKVIPPSKVKFLISQNIFSNPSQKRPENSSQKPLTASVQCFNFGLSQEFPQASTSTG